MKAFHFRLATVGRIRDLEERLAREKLVVSLSELRCAQAASIAAHDTLRAMTPASGTMSANDLLWRDTQRERVAESLRISDARVAAAQGAVVDAKTLWSTAKKRAQVLERLKQSSIAKWREASLLDEHAQSDDLVNARFLVGGAK